MKILLLISSLLLTVQLHASKCKIISKDSIPSISKYLEGDITKSSSGFVNIYEKDNRFLLEIPEPILNRDILTTITIIKGAQNNNRKPNKKFGYGDDSMHYKMVRFQKKGDVLNLLSPDIKYLENNNFIHENYFQSLISPTIYAFPIIAKSNNSYLVDITNYYLGDSELFALAGSKTALDLGSYIQENSYSTDITSYPTNINFRSVRSYTSANPEESTYSSKLWEVGASWILLSEKPLNIRPFDQRVGYFATTVRGQLGDQYDNKTFLIANHWRLEPKPEDLERYLKGALVEPKKPIVFYVDKFMPKHLVPYVINAVNSWQKAFEKAGFKNAIYALPEPTGNDSSDYASDDARYSVISYKASPVPNAYGPSIIDPRSGEIIASHVAVFHTVADLIQMWYFTMCSPSDPQARVYPVAPDLMGKLVGTVVAHEVGHTLGLRHNFMGSTNYPVDSLRNNNFIERKGLGTTIMDYQRFNYIAQPEDHVKQNNLFPRIGVYDEFAIEWGYRYYPDSITPSKLQKIQNNWVNEELKKGDRAFLVETNSTDPRVQSEDSGDDIIYASELGMKNLKFIMNNLESWTEKQPQKDYVLLKRRCLYVLDQYEKYLGHVMRYIGGYYTENKICSHQNYVEEYQSVSYEDQIRALEFLENHLIKEPTWLIKPTFKDKINLDVDLHQRFYPRLDSNILKLSIVGLQINTSETLGETRITNELVHEILFKNIFLNKAKNKVLSEYDKKIQITYLNQLSNNAENQGNISYNLSQFIHAQMYKIKTIAQKRVNNDDTLTKAHYLGILNFIKIWEQGTQKL